MFETPRTQEEFDRIMVELKEDINTLIEFDYDADRHMDDLLPIVMKMCGVCLGPSEYSDQLEEWLGEQQEQATGREHQIYLALKHGTDNIYDMYIDQLMSD